MESAKLTLEKQVSDWKGDSLNCKGSSDLLTVFPGVALRQSQSANYGLLAVYLVNYNNGSYVRGHKYVLCKNEL